MADTLSEQANRAALEAVKTDTPQQFTVGAFIDADGRLRGTATYDRKWSNGWGAIGLL
jgi:hypothetical protein